MSDQKRPTTPTATPPTAAAPTATANRPAPPPTMSSAISRIGKVLDAMPGEEARRVVAALALLYGVTEKAAAVAAVGA